MVEPEAGPSTNTNHGSSHPESTHLTAPKHNLPSRPFYSIEFPGYVQDVPRAIEHLGGQANLNRAFARNATKTDTLLELNWRPGNPFSHPVAGHVKNSNGLLLKVTKKRRKVKDVNGVVGGEVREGEFVAEVVGAIPRTTRFRSMADFQFMPDMSDPVAKLRLAMDRLDVDGIKNYVIPPENEDYYAPARGGSSSVTEGDEPSSPLMRSNLRLFPPPIFSRQTIPHIYNYKQNVASLVTTVVDEETGVERKRFINRHRWKPTGPTIIAYSDKELPTVPPPHVVENQHTADKRILSLLEERFRERPCWTRVALNSHFGSQDIREMLNSKILLSLVCYSFSDGPWRDTYIRLGYDPRVNPAARFYQRLYFRNVNHPIARASVLSRRHEVQEGTRKGMTAQRKAPVNADSAEGGSEGIPITTMPHIFDGVHQSKETAAFQLCDIHDPMLKEMIEDEETVRDECNERDGWYTNHAIEQIKDVLRHKFFSLREGHRPSDAECRALLDKSDTSFTSAPLRAKHKLRHGKHNMAKGALRPEDAAFVRLRAKIDSEARGSSTV